MSTIQLDEKLLQDIQDVLVKHDDKCSNMGVSIQYLAALTGVLAATSPGDMSQKQESLRQLYKFSEQVMTDNSESATTPPPAANNSAFGIWEPK